MNLFCFYQLLLSLVVVFLLASHTAYSSALPDNQKLGPSNYFAKRPCYSRFRDQKTWSSGTCQEPDDPYQCEDGITANTGDCGRREDNGRPITCCIHLSCNSRLSGTCQNNFKNCNGEWFVSDTATGIFGNYDVPIKNPCPEPNFATCCLQKDKMGNSKPGQSTMAPDPTLLSSSGLCSIEVTPNLCLHDKSQLGTVFPLPGYLATGSVHPAQGGSQSYLDNTGDVESQSYLDNTGDIDIFDASFGLGQENWG